MILIYTDKLNPRIEYVFRLIFTTLLQNEVTFTTRSNRFLKSNLPKVNYSYERFGGEFYIKPHRLLHCKALIQPDIQPVWYKGEKYFFESSTDSVFSFDPFAASFYLVSRYEEYLDFEKDRYKRFRAEESLLEKYGLLKKPVVNIWARMIAEELKKRYPELEFPEPVFKFLPTIDIDNAWAYANKGIIRSVGALAKSVVKGNLTELSDRLKVWTGREKDAYDTYEFIHEVFDGYEKEVVFFFLLGNFRQYDKNISWKSKALRSLIREVSSRYEVGIHPSFSSGKKKNQKKILVEKERLQHITGKEIKKSRQHYLRLRFPRTYRNLIKAGVVEDYTMGYPSKTGFRAGICTPFPFYDLKKEAPAPLTIIPFQVMDVTLKNYLDLSPEQAMEEINNLMSEVKDVGGTFSYIWHNETLTDQGEWKGYRDVFMKMNEKGFKWSHAEQ